MKETILIVDDTPANLQLLVSLLGEDGYRTLVAEDGPSALEQLARYKPDMILLDVGMPGCDGFEICRRLKADRELKDIPVLFITVHAEISEKLKGFEVGGLDYITKPIQQKELLARVGAHLTILRQRRQLQTMLHQRQRFMRIAAHDLRNLLGIISGFSNLGLERSDPATKQLALTQIRAACQHMQTLIADFLDLRVIEANKGGPTAAFELQELLTQIVNESVFAAQSKEITLSPRLPAGSCRALGNAAHTHQILTNYVSNALKYSPPGTEMHICLRLKDKQWRVEVQDQGPGVPPGEREQLFVEFARISNRPTGKEISTGLGLSIVKALAEAQQGKVGADFPDTGGSVFWFELPACQ
jgi:two-component system, sensor histidine kinase and response regulator